MKILPDVTSDAMFSDCGKFRYWLTRTWNTELPTIAFIGLNPSVADLDVDDHTVRKCQKFARNWGYGRLLMLNVYAFRSTDPKNMFRALDNWVDITGGKHNTFAALKQYIEQFDVKLTVAAWGRLAYGRGSDAKRAISLLYCLRENSDKSPQHPLYIPYTESLKPWNFVP